MLEDLSYFGEIGDFYRPTNMDTLLPSPFAFVRYRYKECADRAFEHFDGRLYGDKKLTVHEANMQNSYFTQDTGFITNALFDTPQIVRNDFDGSLPEEHFEILRDRQLAKVEEVHTIRVDDIPLIIK